jgi:hypothetical protein
MGEAKQNLYTVLIALDAANRRMGVKDTTLLVTATGISSQEKKPACRYRISRLLDETAAHAGGA